MNAMLTLKGTFDHPAIDNRQELLDLISPSQMKQYRVVPLARSGNRLMLGMLDPSCTLALQDIQLQTGLEIYPVSLPKMGVTLPRPGCLLDAKVALPDWNDLEPAKLGNDFRHENNKRESFFQKREIPQATTQVMFDLGGPAATGETVMTLPLKAGVTIRGGQLIVGGKMVQGFLKERDQARSVYAQTCSNRVPSVILEQHREDSFTVKISNISSGARVLLELTVIEGVEAKVTGAPIRFPMVLGARHGGSFGVRYHLLTRHTALVFHNDRDELPRLRVKSPGVVKAGYASLGAPQRPTRLEPLCDSRPAK